MPKDRKGRSLSSDRTRASPYACSSRYSSKCQPEPPIEDVKEWEEARCPVCMEHPHNAVLLLCSSHEKGCRPYMCDTSYRHSNCLDQFRKSSAENPSTHEEIHSTNLASEAARLETRIEVLEERGVNTLNALGSLPTVPCDSQVKQKLVCPLCRGHINGWTVKECARTFMNSKARSCACETCDYSGTYSDLRKHARVEHPLVRPSVVNPERQNAWRTLERERDLGDVLSTMRSALMEERFTDGLFEGSDSVFTSEEGSLLTVFFLFRVLRPGISSSGSGSNGDDGSRWSIYTRSRVQSELARSRGHLRTQRRTSTPRAESLDRDDDSLAREDENDSDIIPDSWRHNEQSRRHFRRLTFELMSVEMGFGERVVSVEGHGK